MIEKQSVHKNSRVMTKRANGACKIPIEKLHCYKLLKSIVKEHTVHADKNEAINLKLLMFFLHHAVSTGSACSDKSISKIIS